MNVTVTDTLGVAIKEIFPIGIENLEADTLLRSKTIIEKTGDSIVLSNASIDLIFNITTNASWKLSKEKPWGSTASVTWFTNPKPTYGGGNSTSSTTVKINSGSDRRVYIYIATGDSSCIKKYVFLQRKK